MRRILSCANDEQLGRNTRPKANSSVAQFPSHPTNSSGEYRNRGVLRYP